MYFAKWPEHDRSGFARDGCCQFVMSRHSELKICFAAPTGGHLSQLLLLQPVWEGHQVVCVSTVEAVRDKLEAIGPTYIVGECNREHLRERLRDSCR